MQLPERVPSCAQMLGGFFRRCAPFVCSPFLRMLVLLPASCPISYAMVHTVCSNSTAQNASDPEPPALCSARRHLRVVQLCQICSSGALLIGGLPGTAQWAQLRVQGQWRVAAAWAYDTCGWSPGCKSCAAVLVMSPGMAHRPGPGGRPEPCCW
jgi:hypothetical protein